MNAKVGGIVLCGGLSSRMGRPKAWLPFGAELMLPRVVRILTEVVEPIVVVAAQGQELPALKPEIHIARDDKPEQGPLQGIASGLAALSGDVDAAYVSSVDVPFLRPAFVRLMIELLGDHAICVPHVDERHHPLAAIYRLSVLDSVRRLLDQGRMRPMFLFDENDTHVVTREELTGVDPALESLRNLNTPEDYEKALAAVENTKREGIVSRQRLN